MLHRLPSMENAEIRYMINGPESFTPDSRYLLGEVPEVLLSYVSFSPEGNLAIVTIL